MYCDFENTGNVCYTSYLISLLLFLWLRLFVHSLNFGLFKVAVFQTVQHRRIIKVRTNLEGHVARATGFATTLSNICGPH